MNSSAHADTYIPCKVFTMHSIYNVFACAADQDNQKYWFAVLFRRPFSIPLLYPEEVTLIYCYDKAANTVSTEFRSYQRVYSIAPHDGGVIFLRDHYFFLDEEICFFDAGSGKTTVFSKPRTVGRLIALHDNTAYYQGSTAYDDNCIYSYNLITQDIRTLGKDIAAAFADHQQIYAVTSAEPIGIDAYDMNTGALLYSTALDTSSKIIAIYDGIVLTKDGQVYVLDDDGAFVSQKSFDLNKNIDMGWIEEDHLVILSGDDLESYRLNLPEVELIFSQRIKSSIYCIAMQSGELFLLDTDDVSVYLIRVDDGEEQCIIPLADGE